MYSFPDWNQSIVPCLVLIVASWYTYRFLRRQVSYSCLWYSHPFKNFLQFVVIHTVKVFGIINEAEVDFFFGIPLLFLWSNRCWQFDLWFLCLFYIQLYIWKFLVHILLKLILKDFEHYYASMWNECNCAVLWTFLALPFFGIGMKTNLFQSYEM